MMSNHVWLHHQSQCPTHTIFLQTWVHHTYQYRLLFMDIGASFFPRGRGTEGNFPERGPLQILILRETPKGGECTPQ